MQTNSISRCSAVRMTEHASAHLQDRHSCTKCTNASTEIARAKANGAGWEYRLMEQTKPVELHAQDYVKDRQFMTAFGQGQTSGYVNDASQNYGHLATEH